MAGLDNITANHVLEAIQYRTLDRTLLTWRVWRSPEPDAKPVLLCLPWHYGELGGKMQAVG